jgi:histidinol-phosphate aminotransferase
VARTFSKISALAGMRLGYAIAPPALIQRMRPYSMGSINAIVKWGGVAALKDTAAQDDIRRKVITLRTQVSRELQEYGYDVIPSQTNFFMVHIGREVVPVIAEFRQKGVLVGRPFPPMTQHLRVSIGTAEEMARFTTAFRQIFPAKTRSGATSARG